MNRKEQLNRIRKHVRKLKNKDKEKLLMETLQYYLTYDDLHQLMNDNNIPLT